MSDVLHDLGHEAVFAGGVVWMWSNFGQAWASPTFISCSGAELMRTFATVRPVRVVDNPIEPPEPDALHALGHITVWDNDGDPWQWDDSDQLWHLEDETLHRTLTGIELDNTYGPLSSTPPIVLGGES